ncbi:unnamed protein product [Larinioides sclopetarius]|uniref:Uncharacterized protein n=1 Tax=Larinioides sclopetarius TaxID=280406 RepID=A0AAV2B7Y3_9ARAC
MNSFAFLSFVLGFLVVQMAELVNDLKDGFGTFSSGMGALYKNLQKEAELKNGDDEEELGGEGINSDMVYAINKTAGTMAKATEEFINGVVTKTGMHKIGVPVIDGNSRVVEYVKYEMENMMMGMAVMMASAGHMMRV